jgi:hypothetical protein
LQTSVFDPISKKIFFFGGTYEDTLYPGYVAGETEIWHSFSYALTFDTVSGAWGNQTLKGAVIPTVRESHTTTLCKYYQTLSTSDCLISQYNTF